MDVTFTVEGDQIRMRGRMTGTLRHSGEAIVHPVNVAWTVARGKIVRFWVDPSTPEIQEGYRLQGEAMAQPRARPLLEPMLSAMGLSADALGEPAG